MPARLEPRARRAAQSDAVAPLHIVRTGIWPRPRRRPEAGGVRPEGQLNGLGNACLHVEGESRFLEFQIRFGVVL